MKNGILKFTFLTFFLTLASSISAQGAIGSGSSLTTYTIFAITTLIVMGAVLFGVDSLLGVEEKKRGIKNKVSHAALPSLSSLFNSKAPAHLKGKPVTMLTKGHDIKLQGEATIVENAPTKAKTFAVKPTNFVGMSPIPKVTVAVGDEVKAGDILFFDKKRPEIKYAAPVSGEIVAVNRGEKRSIAEVVILADKENMKYRELPAFDLAKASRQELVDHLLEAGVWPMINQRPFDVVPDPTDEPLNIFISTFDTAPLAPDLNHVVEGKGAAFQKGIDLLKKLTKGQIYLGLNGNTENVSTVFTGAQGVEHHWFHGKHPAGNVGVQIHHLNPIKAGDKVWTLGVQEVISIGTLINENRYDASRVVALTGAELKTPHYAHTYLGANVGDLVADNLANDHVRFISGDVLSGKAIAKEGFLDFRADQLTVIEEGDEYEMFGWLLPLSGRPSISPTFPSSFFPDLAFKANTNTHGEKRAFVVTGQYESVMPMDIYVQHLMKSIITNNFERMEGLGIYELTEEDVALCEFTCTSKQPLQQLLREGLNTMREQL